ncbi:hypothetical protein D3C78_1016440 [compost metagenome]
MRQVAGGGQYFVVALDRHVLHIGLQRTPQAVDQRQGGGVGFGQRREDDLVAAEQGGVGGLYPALLGAGDGVAGHEVAQAVAEHLTRSTHHIAFGAADVGDDGAAQVQLCQARQQLFHGQDRYRKLDDVGADTGGSEVFFAAVDHTQGHSLLA